MSTDTKPHLLHVRLNHLEPEGVSYKITCPHDEEGAKRPCAVWMDCYHAEPRAPHIPEPPHTWIDGERVYTEGAAEAAEITTWQRFWQMYDLWAKEHEHGRVGHAKDECWIEQTVSEGSYDEDWELIDFDDVDVAGPVEVAWDNTGGRDDAYLLLQPWTDPTE